MHITSSQPKEAGADTREAPHERLLSNVRPDDTHAQHAKARAPSLGSLLLLLREMEMLGDGLEGNSLPPSALP